MGLDKTGNTVVNPETCYIFSDAYEKIHCCTEKYLLDLMSMLFSDACVKNVIKTEYVPKNMSF